MRLGALVDKVIYGDSPVFIRRRGEIFSTSMPGPITNYPEGILDQTSDDFASSDAAAYVGEDIPFER
jgi:hypothetical protein